MLTLNRYYEMITLDVNDEIWIGESPIDKVGLNEIRSPVDNPRKKVHEP